MSRALTKEEMISRFLGHVDACIYFWKHEAREPTVHGKLEGLAFSMLVLLDGGAGFHPGCKVIPMPHESNKAFRQERGEDWYPEDVDIAGGLHDEFCRRNRERINPPQAPPPGGEGVGR